MRASTTSFAPNATSLQPSSKRQWEWRMFSLLGHLISDSRQQLCYFNLYYMPSCRQHPALRLSSNFRPPSLLHADIYTIDAPTPCVDVRCLCVLFWISLCHCRCDDDRFLHVLLDESMRRVSVAHLDGTWFDYRLATHIPYTSLSSGASDKLFRLLVPILHLSGVWQMCVALVPIIFVMFSLYGRKAIIRIYLCKENEICGASQRNPLSALIPDTLAHTIYTVLGVTEANSFHTEQYSPNRSFELAESMPMKMKKKTKTGGKMNGTKCVDNVHGCALHLFVWMCKPKIYWLYCLVRVCDRW